MWKSAVKARNKKVMHMRKLCIVFEQQCAQVVNLSTSLAIF